MKEKFLEHRFLDHQQSFPLEVLSKGPQEKTLRLGMKLEFRT